jgi:hypothetical protein
VTWAGSGIGVEVFQDGRSYTAQPKDLDVLHVPWAVPCLTTICRIDELGLGPSGSVSSRIGLWSSAVLSRRILDAGSAALKALCATPWSVDWRMGRSGTGRRRWCCGCAGIGAITARLLLFPVYRVRASRAGEDRRGRRICGLRGPSDAI